MALVLADRVKETSTSTGAGNFTLAGASTGFQSFNSAIGTGNTTYYVIENPSVGEWEAGLGTFTAPSTLARTTVYSSSNAGSLVTFSAGTKNVFVDLSATKWPAGVLGVANGGTGTTTSTGSGSVVLSTSPSLTTPALGVATGTSLALNGATLGSNVLATPTSGLVALGSLVNVDSSGRLLVGTTSNTMSSGERFEVYGGASLLDTNSTTVPALYLRNRDVTTGGVFQPYIVFSDVSGNRGGISIDATNSQFNTFAQFGFNWYTGIANYVNLRMAISNTGAVSINNTLAIGGATIGSNALAVTGTASISGLVTAPQFSASNGLFVNSQTIAASYVIPSGSSAYSAGPITISSGITVTISSGSKWVIL